MKPLDAARPLRGFADAAEGTIQIHVFASVAESRRFHLTRFEPRAVS